jgi:hypothetical protein
MRALLSWLVILSGTLTALADDPPAKPPQKNPGFGDLVGALKATPGCLGVETARSSSGKQVIFAWFENKAAAVKWYNSDVHVNLMKKFFPDIPPSRKPMADIPDDSGPIMAIASVTFAEPTKENPSPFKQISIELYQPLNGGLAVGGTFAPEKMKVPPKKEKSAKP